MCLGAMSLLKSQLGAEGSSKGANLAATDSLFSTTIKAEMERTTKCIQSHSEECAGRRRHAVAVSMAVREMFSAYRARAVGDRRGAGKEGLCVCVLGVGCVCVCVGFNRWKIKIKHRNPTPI